MDDRQYSGVGGYLLRLVVMAIAVMVGAWLLPGVEVASLWSVVLTALVISLLNNVVRPILVVITLPVTALTLGLFLFVVNAAIILMASALVDGFVVRDFWQALLLAVVIVVVNYLLELPNRYLQRHDLEPLESPERSDTTEE